MMCVVVQAQFCMQRYIFFVERVRAELNRVQYHAVRGVSMANIWLSVFAMRHILRPRQANERRAGCMLEKNRTFALHLGALARRERKAVAARRPLVLAFGFKYGHWAGGGAIL
ncbi:MAG: hypothetical protein IJV22_06605 [Bacteroidales bacterium]|nr:hypothetical protein [Bacteroidales bacterium]